MCPHCIAAVVTAAIPLVTTGAVGLSLTDSAFRVSNILKGNRSGLSTIVE